MFLEEAVRIKDILSAVETRPGQVVIDIGSSTEEFRCLDQPYIDYYVFSPLRNKGLKTVHVDQKAGQGVDVVCDLMNMKVDTMEKGDIVLCSNLLEHVTNREIILDQIKALTKKGGVIVLTVPYKFKYHADPIDTMYRPSAEELRGLFPKDEFETLAAVSIPVQQGTTNVMAHSFWDLLSEARRKFLKKLHIADILKRFTTPNQVSIVAVRKLL